MNKDFGVHDEASNVRTAVPCVGKAIEDWKRLDKISIQLYLSAQHSHHGPISLSISLSISFIDDQ